MEAKMKKHTNRYIFFDQNVMNKMSQKSKKYEIFQNNVNSLVRTNSKKIEQMFTPFSLLEFIGLKKTEIFDIEYEDKKLNEYRFSSFEVLNDIVFREDTIRDRIKRKNSKSDLKERLNKKEREEINYLNDRGLRYIKHYKNNINILYKPLIENLFFDRVSQINISQFSSKDREQFITSCINLILSIICRNEPMGGLRLVCKVAQEIRKEPEYKQSIKREKDPDMINTVKRMNRVCEKLKSYGDLVDCELVNFAFFGSKNSPCHCYTTDNGNDVMDRLKFYCYYIDFFIRLFCDPNLKLEGKPPQHFVENFTPPQWRCGKVFILDQESGEKITKIPVSKIYSQITALKIGQ